MVVLPTAAAYEHPDHAAERPTQWFDKLGATVRVVAAMDRGGASDEANVAAVRDARFVYLADGSPMHLRSVLMHSPLWDALVAAWQGGTVLAGSGAGAMVLCDPAGRPSRRGVHARPGAAGAGRHGPPGRHVVGGQAPPHPAAHPGGVALAEVDERTALIRDPDGTWRAAGVGSVSVWRDGHQA